MFEGYGIELEYMIVDRDTLDAKPVADELLRDADGAYVNEISRGNIAWSNELVMHVIELKTAGPAGSLKGLEQKFQQQVGEINEQLSEHNTKLMPTAMHPWMNPYSEMKLWPHEYNPIYEAYNRIFDCRGHGWANLQSTHINLPFSTDAEFEKLHAAIRVVLPILPAIAASSPIADMQSKNFSDYRLEVYRLNSIKIPSVTGYIVPEAVFSEKAYDEEIFRKMYRDIAPHDPEKILQDEWLNSRGAIARFDRGSIEIRVLDIQECPRADLAIARIISDVIKSLVNQKWSPLSSQKKWSEKELFRLLMDVIKDGEDTPLDRRYADLFNFSSQNNPTAGDMWQYLFDQLYTDTEIDEDPIMITLNNLLQAGTLSKRIRKAVGQVSRPAVTSVYNELCNCLNENRLFGINE